MESGRPGLASSNIPTMDINQALQNMSLNEIHNFRAIEATVSENPNDLADSRSEQQAEIDHLGVEAQDVQLRLQTATDKTLELKGAIRAAYNLTFDLEVWEQIPIDQQMDFGKREEAIRANDFFLELVSPFVNSLGAVWERAAKTGDKSWLEAKMRFIYAHLPQAEQNIEMVEGKLTEMALAKELDGMRI